MHRVLILGAGKIGALISGLLAESGSYKVQLGDVEGAAADSVVRAHGSPNLVGFALDATVSNLRLGVVDDSKTPDPDSRLMVTTKAFEKPTGPLLQ